MEERAKFPPGFFHNKATIEVTLFEDPKGYTTKLGQKRSLAKVRFRGAHKDSLGKYHFHKWVPLKVICRNEFADQMNALKSGDRVRLEGYFSTEDFCPSDGRHIGLLTFLVGAFDRLEQPAETGLDEAVGEA